MQRRISFVALFLNFTLTAHYWAHASCEIRAEFYLDASALAASKDKIVVLNLWRF